MITTTEHKRLLELHKLIQVNGVHNMKQIELDEFSTLMAKSLEGKGNQPVEELSQASPVESRYAV